MIIISIFVPEWDGVPFSHTPTRKDFMIFSLKLKTFLTRKEEKKNI